MRSLRVGGAAVALLSCFNVTTPTNPPPQVDPPVIACKGPPDAGSDASSSTQNVSGDASLDDASMAIDASDDASDNDASPNDAAVADANAPSPPPPYYDTCTLPPSVCADSHWLAYFDNGVCVNGTCQLVTKYHWCATGCTGGSCYSSGVTAPQRW